MSSPRSNVLPSLALALLLGASILAVQPTGAYPVSTTQQGAVVNALGDGAPYMTWQPREVTNTFYLHSDPTVQPAADGGPNQHFVQGDELQNANVDFTPPTRETTIDDVLAGQVGHEADAQAAMAADTSDYGNVVFVGASEDVLVGQVTGPVARFPMAPAAVALDRLQVHGVAGRVWAACGTQGLDDSGTGAHEDAAFGLLMNVIREKRVNDAWVDDGTVISDVLFAPGSGPVSPLPYAIQPFTAASRSVGSPIQGTGPVVEAGQRLVMEFRATLDTNTLNNIVAAPEVGCFIHYDGTFRDGDGNIRYSFVSLTSDANRLAAYTQDADGRHALGFPSGVPGRFDVVTLQASAWGPDVATQNMGKHANVRIYDAVTGQYLYYVDNSAGGFPREFDTQRIKLASSHRDDLVPQPDIEEHISPSVIRRVFSFAYPADLPETLQVEPQFYSFTDNWELRAPLFAIGGKGIDLRLIDGESTLHRVLPREPTQFTFVVRNIGTSDELVSVSAAEPGSGWTATVLGGGQFFVRPGGQAIGAIEVQPPTSAGAGSTKSISLLASAASSDVEDPDPIALQVSVTNDVVREVGLAGPASSVVVRPGIAKSFPVTITNNGTARDSFVILPSVPANLQGWTVAVTPPSLQMVAGQRTQLQLTITPPAEAQSGSTFPLGLTAVEVGDATVSDRIDIAVQVLSIVGLDVRVLDQSRERNLREDAEDACVDFIPTPACGTTVVVPGEVPPPAGGTQVADAGRSFTDSDFDRSALFRIPITNNGDQPEAFRVEAIWNRTVTGTRDVNGCDGDPSDANANHGSPDGIPDGWRFNWQSAVGSALPAERQLGIGQQDVNGGGGFGGRYQLQGLDAPLVVPARTTVFTFLEIGNVGEFTCTGLANAFTTFDVNSALSSAASLLVTVSSIRDPTLAETVPATVRITPQGTFLGENRYSGGQHLVGITPALNAATTQAAPLSGSASFPLRAINAGNDLDDLVLRATGSALNGGQPWTHSITVTGSTPAGIECETTDGTTRCFDVGVYDEVHLTVRATPPAGVRVGDRDDITVTVSSGDAGGVTAVQRLTARAAGTFAYDAGPLANGTRDGNPGRTLALPFFIENLGTEEDTFVATVTQGDAKWFPVLSTGAGMFLPALTDGAGYLSVTIPEDVTLNQAKQFRIQVTSTEGNQVRTFDLFARPVAPGRLTLTSEEGADVLLPTRGVAVPIDIKALLVTGDEVPVTVSVDTLGLPEGWTVTPSSRTLDLVADSNGRPAGTARFSVTAPSDALATTRAILRVSGTSSAESALKAATDVTLNLASTFGLELNGTALNQTIAPGGDVLYDMRIANRGLGADTVRFTHTALPTDWTMLVNPGSLSLGPLQEKNFTVKLSAPASAEPKDVASFLLFATSVGDPTTLDSVPLLATVGFNELKATLTTSEAYASPQETLVYVVNVTNTGTLPDLVKVSGQIDPPGLVRHIAGNVTPLQFEILPGETVQVRFDQRLGDRIPSGSIVNGTAIFTSLLDERAEPATARVATRGHVLTYALLDLNGDTVPEYAVDRDRDASNGFEQFQASTTSGAVGLRVPDLQKFLRDESREDKSRDIVLANGTTQRVLVYSAVDHCEGADLDSPVGIIDGDCDGRADHFLDMDGDDLPDLYWDPDINKGSRIEFRKDINGDQVPESFVDVNGEGRLDAVFDLTRGAFTQVLNLDVDGDGKLDYVVDKNGNGQVDQDETVLYTRTGSLLIVQKVDVDGDGKLDQVFDTDGDGNPDYFIPSGSKESVAISLRDVNGDGVQDWTFDGDGDGRKESYYDPATGEAHVISAAGHFVDALKKYWYIGALFGLVVVLFAALVLVTRR